MAQRGWLRCLGPAAIVFAGDRVSKVAVDRFTDLGFHKTIIPGLLNLVHARNPGAAFSLFADSDSSVLRPALIVFSIAAAGLILWILRSGHAGSRLAEFGLSLVLGGALGNVWDRIFDGSVVDFVDLHAGTYHWPAFNVADSAITIGAVLVIWDLIFGRGAHHASAPR